MHFVTIKTKFFSFFFNFYFPFYKGTRLSQPPYLLPLSPEARPISWKSCQLLLPFVRLAVITFTVMYPHLPSHLSLGLHSHRPASQTSKTALSKCVLWLFNEIIFSPEKKSHRDISLDIEAVSFHIWPIHYIWSNFAVSSVILLWSTVSVITSIHLCLTVLE